MTEWQQWQRIKSDDGAWTDCFIRIEDDYVTIADSNCGGEPDVYNSVLVHVSQWAKIWEAIQPSVDHEMDKWRYGARSFDEAMLTGHGWPREMFKDGGVLNEEIIGSNPISVVVKGETVTVKPYSYDDKFDGMRRNMDETLAEEQVTEALRKLGSIGVTLAEAIEAWDGTKRDIIFVDEARELEECQCDWEKVEARWEREKKEAMDRLVARLDKAP